MTPKHIEHFAWCVERLVGYEQLDTVQATAGEVVEALTGILWSEEEGSMILEQVERSLA